MPVLPARAGRLLEAEEGTPVLQRSNATPNPQNMEPEPKNPENPKRMEKCGVGALGKDLPRDVHRGDPAHFFGRFARGGRQQVGVPLLHVAPRQAPGVVVVAAGAPQQQHLPAGPARVHHPLGHY